MFSYIHAHVYIDTLRIQVPSEKVFGVSLEGPSTF